MVSRRVSIQCTRNGGLDMPDLMSHWLAERLAYLGRSLSGDVVWRRKASRIFPCLKSDPKAEGRRKPRGEALFVYCTALRNQWPFTASERTISGTRGGLDGEEVCSHWNWAPSSGFLNISEFSLTWQLARNVLPLLGLNFRVGLVDIPDCARCCSGLKETAEHAFYYCQRVRLFWDHVGEWTARIEPKQLVLLDVRQRLGWEACDISRDPSSS